MRIAATSLSNTSRIGHNRRNSYHIRKRNSLKNTLILDSCYHIVTKKQKLELIGIVKPKTIMKRWAKREEQIERVMGATVGMYGDLQGIAGKSLQEIDGLELSILGDNSVLKDMGV